jgi:hypothetical protein
MKQQVGRLAMRQEGTLWVAYYALPHTMDGALFLGSIRMAGVVGSPARKQRFMGMMKDMVADILRGQGAPIDTWADPVSAPEHERGGRA